MFELEPPGLEDVEDTVVRHGVAGWPARRGREAGVPAVGPGPHGEGAASQPPVPWTERRRCAVTALLVVVFHGEPAGLGSRAELAVWSAVRLDVRRA